MSVNIFMDRHEKYALIGWTKQFSCRAHFGIWQASASWIEWNVCWYENKARDYPKNLVWLNFRVEIDYDMSSRHPYDHWNVLTHHNVWFHTNEPDPCEWCTAWYWQTWKAIMLPINLGLRWMYGNDVHCTAHTDEKVKKKLVKYLMPNIWNKNQHIQWSECDGTWWK